MRRFFRRGATNTPASSRPGVPYGQYCYGAPGPTCDVEPSPEITPELFTGEKVRKNIVIFNYDDDDCVIDLTID